ncbi:MarR family winged helix-turn-helix transcriptional regulator [Psychromonas sp. PT13]|uniref:MarR family winged helix-turn-helix transcriptional regulator n=1 Tax=Psychromonas sp. PT13 TaxID=3439547 RepID=UPI003EBF0553
MSDYRRINHALRVIHMNIRCKMSAEVKRQNVEFSPLEHIAMGQILKSDGTSQQMLVASMNKDKAQIARIVARLLRQGLIIKQENPEDKRAVLLHLSSKGKKLLTRLDQVELEVMSEMMNGFSQQESNTFRDLLERINHNL